ncbi:MAG: hypothetical protein KGL39_40625 [Patescibacteria group bacterium]|nr:hypothetical protein [Patescibacteria group bacterium]
MDDVSNGLGQDAVKGLSLRMVRYQIPEFLGLCQSLREDIIRGLRHNFRVYLSGFEKDDGLVLYDILYSSGGDTKH